MHAWAMDATRPKKKIPLVEKFNFDDEEPSLLANPDDVERRLSASSLPESSLVANKSDGFLRRFSPRVKRDHWSQASNHTACSGCNKEFTLSRRKSHCRKCGQVFCQSCVRYKLTLNREAEYDPRGEPCKVCYRCAREQEEFALGQSRSHTVDFRFERKQHHVKQSHSGSDCNALLKHHLPEKYTDMLDTFMADAKKPDKNRVQAKLQKAIEMSKRATTCRGEDCQRQLLLPTDRKLCASCQGVFCEACTAKDLVVFFPHDDRDSEPRLSIAQTIAVTSQRSENSRVYRACLACRNDLHGVCQSYYFHLDLEVFQAQLLDLQTQISSALTRAVSPRENTSKHPTKCSSEGNLLDIDSHQGNTEKEVDKRVLEKLFQQYYRVMTQLKSLSPTTGVQKQLFERVVRGTSSYYLAKRSYFRLELGL